MEFSEVIARRYSCRSYDPGAELDDATLGKLIHAATQSPSSFNLQHWRFVVVRNPEIRQAISAASWNQKHVAECSAVVAVCAKLDSHMASPSPMIQGFYEGNNELMRDEAIRSGGLAAMTLMHAATDLGWDSCPMIGFDPIKVGALINLPEGWLITMLVVLGKGTGKMPPRDRLPVDNVLHLETCDGPGLG